MLLCVAATFASSLAHAQLAPIQYFRTDDQQGLNTFETTKNDTTQYTGMHIRFGGAFAQDYQALSASNSYGSPANPAKLNHSDSLYSLAKLTSGFNLAMANMTIDGQLEDGIRVNVTMYLSSRHHNESWVKNGYLQIDKMSFLNYGPINDIMKSLTLKVGDLDVDYGDQHFRRVDGGNEMYNPFVENYIMDEFATEIGAEAYWHDPSGLFLMVGATDGMLNPTVVASDNPGGVKVDSSTHTLNSYNPAFHGKLGFDKQLNSDLRVRITGSFYQESSTSSSTLFGGDRTGSHYFWVMENALTLTTSQGFSGRFNPSFTDEVSTFMVNPFVKFSGLEFFGTYENAKGRTIAEKTTRSASQLAGDLIYRFGDHERFWVGARYDQVKATLPVSLADITISREVASVGWFLTPNVMMKAEYVAQKYDNYPSTSILNGGKFNGVVVEAALGF